MASSIAQRVAFEQWQRQQLARKRHRLFVKSTSGLLQVQNEDNGSELLDSMPRFARPWQPARLRKLDSLKAGPGHNSTPRQVVAFNRTLLLESDNAKRPKPPGTSVSQRRRRQRQKMTRSMSSPAVSQLLEDADYEWSIQDEPHYSHHPLGQRLQSLKTAPSREYVALVAEMNRKRRIEHRELMEDHQQVNDRILQYRRDALRRQKVDSDESRRRKERSSSRRLTRKGSSGQGPVRRQRRRRQHSPTKVSSETDDPDDGNMHEANSPSPMQRNGESYEKTKQSMSKRPVTAEDLIAGALREAQDYLNDLQLE